MCELNAQGAVSSRGEKPEVTSLYSTSPPNVTPAHHYPLSVPQSPFVHGGEGALIALSSPLWTLKCPSLVRGLADGTSLSQSTDGGRTLEALDRRNKEGSLSPWTTAPTLHVQVPSPFPKAHLFLTAKFSASRSSKGFYKIKLHRLGSSTVSNSGSLRQNITSVFPKSSH